MALDFSVVEQTINQTKIEVGEHEVAVASLDKAKEDLGTAQVAVAGAQTVVAEASAVANKEKADVVNGINAAIAALQDLLAQLA